jgi:hypothetical protein
VNYPLAFSKPLLKAAENTKFVYQLKREVKFLGVLSECFEFKLRDLESHLPELLAFLLYYQYQTGVSKVSELLKVLKKINPQNFDLSHGHLFYESRLIRLFTELLSGMIPDGIWNRDDHMVFYLKDDDNFLLNNTQFDMLPVEQNNYYRILTLQISFIPGTSLKA